jgi:hypothetical protein
LTRLFRLYGEIPEVKEGDPLEVTAGEAMSYLHSKTGQVKGLMNSQKELMKTLFDRLIIYYDTKLRRSGEKLVPITYDLEGYVTISLFDYEAFTMTTTVRRGSAKGDEVAQDMQQIKEIQMPEGFALEFSLQFWPKTMTTYVGL